MNQYHDDEQSRSRLSLHEFQHLQLSKAHVRLTIARYTVLFSLCGSGTEDKISGLESRIATHGTIEATGLYLSSCNILQHQPASTLMHLQCHRSEPHCAQVCMGLSAAQR